MVALGVPQAVNAIRMIALTIRKKTRRSPPTLGGIANTLPPETMFLVFSDALEPAGNFWDPAAVLNNWRTFVLNFHNSTQPFGKRKTQWYMVMVSEVHQGTLTFPF